MSDTTWREAYNELCSRLAYELGVENASIAGDYQVEARVRRLRGEANEARAALARVREMHIRIMGPTEVGQPGSERCDACLEIYPCPTIREINRSTSE